MVEFIKELLEAKNYRRISELLKEIEVPDAVEVLESLESANLFLFFRLLPKDKAADVFAYLNADDKKTIIDSFTENQMDEMMEILNDLYFDDMVDLIEEMPANVVDRILAQTDDNKRKMINQFLNYPDESAGSLMTIEYVELRPEMTVEEALAHIREVGIDKETVYTCYVIDEKRKLIGIISLRNLVTSDKYEKIANIMKENYISVTTTAEQEKVIQIFRDYGFIAIPVTDNEHRLTGIITFDDIVLLIDEETTEDFEHIAGITPSKDEYMEASIWSLSKNRITWLMILMISATFTGYIIEGYEKILSSMIILSSFIPMLMDTGGNAGSQASTIIIRGMALGEIEDKDFFRVIAKEFTIGLIVGFSVAAVNFVRLYFFTSADIRISFAVSATLLMVVLLAKITGCILPFMAQKLKFDPAIMAGPLITTVVDAVALVIYFNLAKAIIGI